MGGDVAVEEDDVAFAADGIAGRGVVEARNDVAELPVSPFRFRPGSSSAR